MIQTTENLPFGNLLMQRFPLQIPKYQRSYAWDEDEIDDFIRDIQMLYKNRFINNNPKPHFFGGIVSVKKTAGGTYTGNEYDIVDGQQRLTTIMLTLNTLMAGLQEVSLDALRNNDPNNSSNASLHSDVIHNKYLVYPEVEGSIITHCNRIRLSKSDNNFFSKLLSNTDNTRSTNEFIRDSHRKLQYAWNNIYKNLVNPILIDINNSIEEKIKQILIMLACLTEDCYIIHIISDNHKEAYQLFSILNDRGKNLNDGDLLRSYTLDLLENFSTYQNYAEQSWDIILGYKDSQIDLFLKTYYPSYKGIRAPQREIVDVYIKDFFDDLSSTNSVITENIAVKISNNIMDMKNEAMNFFDINSGQWPYQNPIMKMWDQDRLTKLIKILKHTICIPILLSARAHLSEESFAKIVSILERFSFRYITITGAHAGRLGNIYNKHAKMIREIRNNYDIQFLVDDLLQIQNEYAKDSVFITRINDQLIYNSTSKNTIKYFLSTLDDYYNWFNNGANGYPKPEKTRILDINTLTIEHIYPQNPQSIDNNLEDKTHNISNLSIWSANDNRTASNNEFINKKHLYQQSSIFINRYLGNLSIWDINEFTKRKEKIMKMALKIFTV